jgi:predicted amidohydrolase
LLTKVMRRERRRKPQNRRIFLLAPAGIGGRLAASAAVRGADQRSYGMSTRARVATVCQGSRRLGSIEANRDFVLGLLDRALQEKPDIVCLPEAFATVSSAEPLERRCEPLDGPTVSAAAERARAHDCYVICPLKMRRDGRLYNSAVILDRAGEVAGIYDKACPVNTAADYTVFEDGVTPGPPDVPVFDLDIGRIGIQICFDAVFPENWAVLGGKGAKLVFWPSAYEGGFPLQAFAWLGHYYVVSSTRAGETRMIDPLGTIVEQTDQHADPDRLVLVREINLDHLVVHYDYNFQTPVRIRERYGDRVELRDPPHRSGHFLVEPIDPTVTCAQLAEEFAFEPAAQYVDRHREAFGHIRAGRRPPPQQAAHGDRPKYR